MPRLLESEITKYLETLEDSKDGLDGSDSEVEDEGHYYQTARDVLRDLENSDEGENAQSDEVDADPPLVIDNDQNMPDPPILEAGEAVPQNHPDYDRLFKIRPLEEMLNCQFGKVPLDQRLSIDEQMCATKMSHYIKQYMPNKPHKWGFKLYLICSLQGYAHRFEVYSGGGSKNNILPGEPDLGESGNTVVRLARMVPRNVNHIIYFDNFYTSVPLVTYLAKEGIFSLGTVRVNRLRNCKLPDKNTIMKKNVPRGFYEENVATVDDIDVSAVVWKDNKPVNLLSTYVGAEPATTVTRFDKSKKERVAIPCPKVIKEYNAHMGGVDLLDSFIGRYHITMKSRKWTMRLFYHFLDLAVINSWVMFKKNII
ncbi:piggyBac transposable element-derived protein 2-like [Trichoplusia ni]|uniref:PiggyBac transposable element-derived protein 2-like n=1 Tax=Trichoplusia ni TaxID=7111 RepID=A0A7E5WP07_TRINI|nr:piggyBac transposable element-derived protein 2-like [Trichoplusia ni]